MVDTLAAFTGEKAAAREHALVHQQALQPQIAVHQSYQTARRHYLFPLVERSWVWKRDYVSGEIIPGRFRRNCQPMTKSGQVCMKLLAGTCT